LRTVVALCALLPVVSASSAWSDFVNYRAEASQASSSRRLLFNGGDTPVYEEYSGTAFVQSSASYTKDPGASRSFTVNSFIFGDCGSQSKVGSPSPQQLCVKQRVFDLCYNASAGTDFYGTVSAAHKGSTAGPTSSDNTPPQCMMCLSQGWGTSEATPGFYLPCGCQRTCVDVSGNSKRAFADVVPASGGFPFMQKSFLVPYGVASDTDKMGEQPLATCQDYIKTNIVTTCTQMNIFHFVLWPSILAAMALVFVAYSMMNMSLDMDSLLYTVGSSSKKDN